MAFKKEHFLHIISCMEEQAPSETVIVLREDLEGILRNFQELIEIADAFMENGDRLEEFAERAIYLHRYKGSLEP